MPEIIKERMLIVWETEGENVGAFRGAHIDELIRYEDGSTRNQQRPLTEQDADDLVGSIDTATATQLTEATATIATLTTERDTALADVARVTTDNTSLTQANAQLAALNLALQTQLTASQAHATDLESQLDRVVTGAGNRRLISPRAWQARFTQDEELDLSISSDSGIIQGLMAVKQLIQANRLFSIDHAMTSATLDAMIRVGIIDESRKTNLMRDSLASERVLS